MTNEELVADLKQFIEATVSQQTADLRVDFKDLRTEVNDIRTGLTDLRAETKSLRTEMKEGFEAVDEKLDEIQNAVGEKFHDHERRIRRLEQHAT